MDMSPALALLEVAAGEQQQWWEERLDDDAPVTNSFVQVGSQARQVPSSPQSLSGFSEATVVPAGYDMAVVYIHEPDPTREPSLTSTNTLAESLPESSVPTQDPIQEYALPDPNSPVPDPIDTTTATAPFKCLFPFLGCWNTYHDADEWKMHCKRHLGSQNRGPRKAICPHCSALLKSESGRTGWETMLDHIVENHYTDYTPASLLANDVDFLRYLHQQRVIGNAEYRELQAHGSLGKETEQWTQIHGDGYEQRRGGGRAQPGRGYGYGYVT